MDNLEDNLIDFTVTQIMFVVNLILRKAHACVI